MAIVNHYKIKQAIALIITPLLLITFMGGDQTAYDTDI
jgi:hypothetical protein